MALLFCMKSVVKHKKKIKNKKNMKRKQHILRQLSCTKLYDYLQVELNPRLSDGPKLKAF